MQDIELVFTNSGHHSLVKKKDIPAVVDSLREVKRHNHGRLTAKLAYAAAKKDRNGVLGSYVFKDAPSTAAEKWYIQQAGEVIRSVHVYLVINKREMQPVRWVSSVVEKRPEKRGVSYNYVETLEAMQDSRYREQLIANALSEVRSWAAKHKALMEYSKVLKKVGKAIFRITGNAF
jgi:hypothetical protein